MACRESLRFVAKGFGKNDIAFLQQELYYYIMPVIYPIIIEHWNDVSKPDLKESQQQKEEYYVKEQECRRLEEFVENRCELIVTSDVLQAFQLILRMSWQSSIST